MPDSHPAPPWRITSERLLQEFRERVDLRGHESASRVDDLASACDGRHSDGSGTKSPRAKSSPTMKVGSMVIPLCCKRGTAKQITTVGTRISANANGHDTVRAITKQFACNKIRDVIANRRGATSLEDALQAFAPTVSATETTDALDAGVIILAVPSEVAREVAGCTVTGSARSWWMPPTRSSFRPSSHRILAAVPPVRLWRRSSREPRSSRRSTHYRQRCLWKIRSGVRAIARSSFQMTTSMSTSRSHRSPTCSASVPRSWVVLKKTVCCNSSVVC